MSGDGWQQGQGQGLPSGEQTMGGDRWQPQFHGKGCPQQSPFVQHSGKGHNTGWQDEGHWGQDTGKGMSRVIKGKLVYGQNAVPPGYGPSVKWQGTLMPREGRSWREHRYYPHVVMHQCCGG